MKQGDEVVMSSDQSSSATAQVSAQVSLYPLRPEHLDTVIEAAIQHWRTRRLDVYPGPMSTILAGNGGEVWAALREAFEAATQQCETVMVITLSNACPVPMEQKT
jgi:uncharacterized protein YqgV (UPF0045/DUF77 family)